MPDPATTDILTFTLVGHPNDGKTTLASTLAEDDSAVVADRAGTTKVRETHDFKLNGQTVLRFIDTPGFENTPQLRHWFEQHAKEPGDLALRFIAEHEADPRYRPECEILKAIQGAIVIFVVDGSRAIDPPDYDHAVILRLCCDYRVAVINHAQSAGAEFLEAWQELLRRDGFTAYKFDAHHVSFADRIELLRNMKGAVPELSTAINRSEQLLREAWEGRLQDVRNEVIAFLETCLTASVSAPISTRDEVESAKQVATAKLRERLRKEEEHLRTRIRALFRHTRTSWQLAPMDVLGEDLFSEQVWIFLGLNRSQLIWAGAAAGLLTGGTIDAAALGHLLGIPSALFTAAGAVTGWLSSGKSIQLETPSFFLGKFRLPGAQVKSSQAVTAQAHTQSNLLWIMIDRALGYVQFAAAWSHGRRDGTVIPIGETDERLGVTSRWTKEQKATVLDWVSKLRKQRLGGSAELEAARGKAQGVLLEAIRALVA